MQTYLPPDLDADDVAAVIGLISDTHIPRRWPDVPATIAGIFRGVDLILHAGDLGELWVLDRLSRIAPVIAVQGNDDTPDAHRQLPVRQLPVVAERRILLWHSHFADPAEEMAFRRQDEWQPKLQRLARQGRRAGADVVVWGHMHVPLQRRFDGVLLINPGAIASGNYFLRQTRQTVALLFLHRDGTPFVKHVDLAQPDRVYPAEVDWSAGVRAALARYSESILAPDLRHLPGRVHASQLVDRAALWQAIAPLAHRCWAGEQRVMTGAQILARVEKAPDIAAEDRATLRSLLTPL